MSAGDTTYTRPRRHRRVPYERRIQLQTMTWPDLAAALARDVSYGGIGLELKQPVRPGDRFLFILELPDGQKKRLTAEVRYAGPDGRVGLSWVELDPEALAALQSFVDGLAA
jgi:hypothetical protein